MKHQQTNTVHRPEPLSQSPVRPVEDDILAPTAADAHPARSGVGLDGGAGLAGLPLGHPTAGAARAAAVLALQRTHGNAYVQQLDRPGVVRRQPTEAPRPSAGQQAALLRAV